MAKKRSRLSEVFSVTMHAPPKTWEYRGRVIEEDFESWSNSTPGKMLSHRTGYVIQAAGYEKHGNYVPGKFRTLAEAKRGVDEVLSQGFW